MSKIIVSLSAKEFAKELPADRQVKVAVESLHRLFAQLAQVKSAEGKIFTYCGTTDDAKILSKAEAILSPLVVSGTAVVKNIKAATLEPLIIDAVANVVVKSYCVQINNAPAFAIQTYKFGLAGQVSVIASIDTQFFH